MLVSIVTPVFNGEKYISKTIDSIISQTYENWELIVVNDGSSDDSAAVVDELLKKDCRIKLLNFEENKGAAAARNAGIHAARGDFIAFCDGDDLWYPEKLEKQLDLMHKNGYGFTFTEFCIIDGDEKIIKERVKCPKEVGYFNLITGNPIMCSSVLIDRNIIGGFEMPPIRSAQDYATWAQIMRDKKVKAYCVNEPLAKYRKAGQTLSSRKFKAFKRTWRINRDFLGMSLIKTSFVIAIYAVRWFIKHYTKNGGKNV